MNEPMVRMSWRVASIDDASEAEVSDSHDAMVRHLAVQFSSGCCADERSPKYFCVTECVEYTPYYFVRYANDALLNPDGTTPKRAPLAALGIRNSVKRRVAFDVSIALSEVFSTFSSTRAFLPEVLAIVYANGVVVPLRMSDLFEGSAAPVSADDAEGVMLAQLYRKDEDAEELLGLLNAEEVFDITKGRSRTACFPPWDWDDYARLAGWGDAPLFKGRPSVAAFLNLSSPCSAAAHTPTGLLQNLYGFLKSRVYAQDAYCRRAAVIMERHLSGQPSVYAVSGPSGCGKTFLWECLRERYPQVHIFDASTITESGIRGTSVSELVNLPEGSDPVLVFDEFDKLVRGKIVGGPGGNRDVSPTIQAEFLKLIDGTVSVASSNSAGERTAREVRLGCVTVVLCGSFEERNDEKVRERRSMGFGADIEGEKERYRIGIEDMRAYGMIKELASRITDVIRVEELPLEDFEGFAAKAAEDAAAHSYGDPTLTEAELKSIARAAHESGLGLRAVKNGIRARLDEMRAEGLAGGSEAAKEGEAVLS